jgi:methyl-accepting chemotaxis protein PixJ
MTATYDPALVLLSIGVAILGSLTALALTAGGYDRHFGAWRTSFALANGGLVMGSTIWSMHFIAMMAVSLPVPVNYSMLETVGSILVAILATGVGLYLTRARLLGRGSIPIGGLLMGLGIAGMHYLGMSAIRGCGLAYDRQLVGASVAIAIAASTAALWFTFALRRGVFATLAGGTVQGLAIASMHYTAMAATFFVPLEMTVELSTPLFSQSMLAYLIAGGIAAVSVANLALLGLLSSQVSGVRFQVSEGTSRREQRPET